MNNPNRFRLHTSVALVVVVASIMLGLAPTALAGSWNNLEPLKSRRADVERVLGKPLDDKAGETATLRFKVAGGTVQVSFVNARFVETKKLSPELEGTVLQIVLQHDRATDTPESLGLLKNSDFQREEKQGVTQFRNLKDGIAYTFIEGKLKTTWYSPASEQLMRARIKG